MFYAPSQEVEDLGLGPQEMEERLADWLNRERDKTGLPMLTLDNKLRELARAHSQKMADENKLGHNFKDYPALDERANQADIFFTLIGENVAASEIFVMRFVHEALMASPGHKENILDPQFSHLGIGIIKKGDTYYTTQVFAWLINPQTTEEMEDLLIRKIAAKFPPDQLSPMLNNPKLKDLCRNRAEEFMKGLASKDLSDQWPWGKADLVSHTFSKPDDVLDKLLAELKNQPKGWILGVAFGRTPANSGGIYSVTLVTFPRLVTMNDPHRYIFDQINKYRSDQGKIPTHWSDALAQTARKASLLFLKNSHMPDLSKKYKLFFVYETLDLTTLPDPLPNLFLQKNIKSMGISVLEPLSPIHDKNSIIVALVGL